MEIDLASDKITHSNGRESAMEIMIRDDEVVLQPHRIDYRVRKFLPRSQLQFNLPLKHFVAQSK